MSLSVLSVAYPFAPVGRDVAGGAEQVLSTLDRALVGAGCRSLVLAQEGSEAAGTLIPVPALGGDLTEAARAEFRELYRRRIEAILREERVDLVHFHGIDFPDYAPRTHGSRPDGDVPMLATLHLPPGWYPASVFAAPRRALAQPGVPRAGGGVPALALASGADREWGGCRCPSEHSPRQARLRHRAGPDLP